MYSADDINARKAEVEHLLGLVLSADEHFECSAESPLIYTTHVKTLRGFRVTEEAAELIVLFASIIEDREAVPHPSESA